VRARAEEKARIGNYKESKKAGEEARKKQEEEDKEDAKPRVLFSPMTTGRNIGKYDVFVVMGRRGWLRRTF